mmetsp:Transcript_60969/g.96918  ORF Transcript_60969/g.96918 Transcript_60969/m.96918 type:complete len:376 (-) Transcript_60969:193-1320(-)
MAVNRRADEMEDIEEDDDLAMDMYDESDATGPLFWSLKLEANKPQEIDQPAIEGYIVHVTNACFGVNVQPKSRTVVMVNSGEEQDPSTEAPICVLRQGQHESHPLDLLFNESATITLKGQKPSEVFLTGYLQPPVESDQDAAMSMLEDADEEEIQKALARQKKLGRVLDEEDDEEDEEEETPAVIEEEEEEEEEEEAVQPPTKKQKTNKGAKATKNGGKAEQQKRKSPQQKPKKAPQDVGKEEDHKSEETSEQKEAQKGKKSKKMQNMKGGIKYRDMKIGDGKQISNGDKVNVFYVGQTDDKQVFDKCLSGPGFEFTLGKGDVIKGWDHGLKGMRVGGKRKLVIPAKMAYGASGSPPSIPPNATLTFTIELKGVN